MDRATFKRFQEIVYEHSGISLRDTKEAMVSARIAKRMRALGIVNHKQYLHHLEQDTSGDEINLFLDVISTNVTSFFRESLHFDFLKRYVQEALADGRSKIRIWSAASSTGEEALSIAMAMHEVLGARPFDFKILASDISTQVLARAKSGIYEQEQMENVPESLRRRYFVRVKAAGKVVFQVRDVLKKHIVYRRLNLSRPPFPMRGQLDIVFCRNVMIYFDNVTRSRLVDEIYRLLLPGGYFLTGHAESLTSLESAFVCMQPTIYKKNNSV